MWIPSIRYHGNARLAFHWFVCRLSCPFVKTCRFRYCLGLRYKWLIKQSVSAVWFQAATSLQKNHATKHVTTSDIGWAARHLVLPVWLCVVMRTSRQERKDPLLKIEVFRMGRKNIQIYVSKISVALYICNFRIRITMHCSASNLLILFFFFPYSSILLRLFLVLLLVLVLYVMVVWTNNISPSHFSRKDTTERNCEKISTLPGNGDHISVRIHLFFE